MKSKSEKKKNELSKLKKLMKICPNGKKEVLNNWTENLKKSCKQYWEDKEY